MDANTLSNLIIGAAIEVHRNFGPGLLESAYGEALAYEFQSRSIPYEKEKPIPVYYKDLRLEMGFRADFLVGGLVIVEIKAVSELSPSHDAQIINYLKLSRSPLGLLLNFHAPLMRYGIRRFANAPDDPQPKRIRGTLAVR